MSELRSIVLAIEHATRQRDEFAKAVARAKRNVGFAEDQMAQLQGYATETDSRWTGAAPGVLSAELIRHHYQFMDRLQQAIGMQSGVLANNRRQLELANKTLLQAEFRLSGLNQILKTRQAVVLRKQERREQRQTDEFAAMLHTRTRALAENGELK